MKKLLLSLILLFNFSLQAEEIVMIVNEQNPINELSLVQVQNYFLKRTREWPNGQVVRFFDRREGSEERKIFLRDLLKKSSRDVELYWIGQKLYSGNTAPLQVSTDSMMASMISRFPGAIGYVSSSFQGAPGVRKVALRKDP